MSSTDELARTAAAVADEEMLPPTPIGSCSSTTTNCCAYLCTFCPRTSFASMEMLETHIRQEHSPAGNEQKTESAHQQHQPDQQMNDDGSPPPAALIAGDLASLGSSAVHSPASSSSSSSASSSSESVQQQNSSASVATVSAPLTCKKCPGGRTFDNAELLSQHSANTHRDRPHYACAQCGAVFSIKRELATHNRIHSGEQPHTCDQCGKQFGTRQLLKKHNMWHGGHRAHVCPECGKAFFQKGHLTQHLMIHTGNRHFKCGLCEKTFIFKFDLNRHLKIHSERNFVCCRCAKCFQFQSELDEHSQKCKCKGGAGTRGGHRRTSKSSLTDSKASPVPLSTASPHSSLHIKTEHQTASEAPMEMGEEEEEKVQHQLANGHNNNHRWNSVVAEERRGNNNIGEMKTETGECQQQQRQQQAHQCTTNANLAFRPTTLLNESTGGPGQQQPQISFGHLAAALLANRSNGGGVAQLGQQQQQFPCLLCPQRFGNQSAYLFHWGLTHMRDFGAGQSTDDGLLALFSFHQKLAAAALPMPFGGDSTRLHLQPPADAINSPQKVSPALSSTGSSTSSSLDGAQQPAATMSANPLGSGHSLLLEQHFPGLAGMQAMPAPLLQCPNCPMERQRLVDKERELAQTQAQLDRIRGLFLHLESILPHHQQGGLSNDGLPPPPNGNINGWIGQLLLLGAQSRAPN